MMRCITLLVFSVLLAGTQPITAAEIKLRSKVDTVTIFPDGAEVARSLTVALEAGAHVIVVADLPATLQENSLRVEGEATNDVEISSIDVRRILVRKPSPAGGLEDGERSRLEEDIKRLTDERGALDGAIAAANAQRALAENMSHLPLASQKNGQDREPGAADWNKLFDLIGARIQDSAKNAQAAQIKQRGLDERIKGLKDRLALEPKEEWERTEVRLYVEARGPVRGAISLRYQVEHASWQPIYDARLATGGASREVALTIARRASIAQSTGEDWDDASVTLSTVRPGAETSVPDLNAMKVAFKPETAPAQAEPKIGRAPDQRTSESGEKAAASALPVKEREGAVENTPYQAAFKIPQHITVKSGVGEKKVFIASETAKPTLAIYTAPKKDTAAYLHARFTYAGLAPILPGEVSLYHDGVFIGLAELPLTTNGEELELGFGRDDAVKVARVELKRAKGESGVISTSSTDEQHFKITVKNLHDFAVPVTVTDQVPVSEDEKIVVELLPMTTEPSERNYDDKQGVLAWTFDLKPQEEREIALSYEVKWPNKREIMVNEP